MKRVILVWLLQSLLLPYIKGQIPQTSEKAELDSLLFSLSRSKNNFKADSTVFEEGFRIIRSRIWEPKEFKEIEKKADYFNSPERTYFYVKLKLALYLSLINSKQFEQALIYGKNILDTPENLKIPQSEVLHLVLLQHFTAPFIMMGKLKDGFDYYSARLNYYLKKNDTAGIYICYWRLSRLSSAKGLNELAIYYTKKSIEYASYRLIGERKVLIGYLENANRTRKNNTAVLGQLYLNVGNYKEAIRISNQAAAIRNIDQDSSLLDFIPCTIAYAKLMLNETDSVLYLLDQSIKIAGLIREYTQLSSAFEIKGFYYFKMNQFDSAENNLQVCKKIMKQHHIAAWSTAGILIPNYYLALIRIEQKRYLVNVH